MGLAPPRCFAGSPEKPIVTRSLYLTAECTSLFLSNLLLGAVRSQSASWGELSMQESLSPDDHQPPVDKLAFICDIQIWIPTKQEKS